MFYSVTLYSDYQATFVLGAIILVISAFLTSRLAVSLSINKFISMR